MNSTPIEQPLSAFKDGGQMFTNPLLSLDGHDPCSCFSRKARCLRRKRSRRFLRKRGSFSELVMYLCEDWCEPHWGRALSEDRLLWRCWPVEVSVTARSELELSAAPCLSNDQPHHLVMVMYVSIPQCSTLIKCVNEFSSSERQTMNFIFSSYLTVLAVEYFVI